MDSVKSVGMAIVLLLIPFGPARADQASGDAGETESILTDMVKNAPDTESRLKLLNSIVRSYPGASATWASEQIFQVYEETGRWEEALETGEKILALDCEDIEIAYKCLKIAGQKGDAALARKWSQLASGTAASIVASPKDDETGRRRLEYAHQVRNNLGYLKYREIAAMADSAKKLDLLEDFLRWNKDSEYRHAAGSLYLVTCRESGNGRKTLAAAEKILKLDDSNEDALLIIANSYQDSQNDPQKLTAYANKILVAVNRKQPVEMKDAEWTNKKARLTGAAYWMIGAALMQQNHFSAADKSIRIALPYLKGDTRLMSAALFYLGWANYQMHNYADAVRFNEQCMSMKGPYQEQAARNLQVIRAESDSQ